MLLTAHWYKQTLVFPQGCSITFTFTTNSLTGFSPRTSSAIQCQKSKTQTTLTFSFPEQVREHSRHNHNMPQRL